MCEAEMRINYYASMKRIFFGCSFVLKDIMTHVRLNAHSTVG